MSGIFKSGVFSQGFDKTTVINQVFTSITGSATINSSFARFVAPTGFISQGMQITGGGQGQGQLAFGTQLTTMILGIALKPVTFPASGNSFLLEFMDTVAGVGQVTIALLPGGQIQALRGDVLSGLTSLGISTATIPVNAYSQLQVQVTISTTVGVVEILLNGNPSPILSLTGINTQKTANTFTDAVKLGGAVTTQYDDWWMLDKTGSLNTYLGDKVVRTPLITADSATVGLNNWSTSPSQSTGNHYLNINENPPNDGTSFNFSATPGTRESYRTSQIVQSVGAISFINVFGRIQKDDGTARTIALMARNSNTDATGDTISDPSSWATVNTPFLNSPATSAPWTIAGYNGAGPQSDAEFGITVVS